MDNYNHLALHRRSRTRITDQDQIRLDIGIAAAETCFGTRSNAMSTHQDLIPETHTRTSKKCKRSPKKDLLDRGPREIFIQELPTSKPRELSYKHQRRASSKSYCKTS
jgi:hypothetical protein